MDSAGCTYCQKPKAQLSCGLCKEAICRACAHITPENSFSFLNSIPEELNQGFYCPTCFDNKVEPELTAYRQALQRAKQVNIYYKKQSKESRLYKRHAAPIEVTCADKDEAVLRLAFMAVKADFNTIVDVDLSAQKVRNEGYQTSIWKAKGIPVHSTK
jgi:hypothetical protein